MELAELRDDEAGRRGGRRAGDENKKGLEKLGPIAGDAVSLK